MKMAYERPVMSAELYQANRSVAACDKPYVASVNYADGNWYTGIKDKENGNGSMVFNPENYDTTSLNNYDLSHTFDLDKFEGGIPDAFDGTDSRNYYWECNCAEHGGHETGTPEGKYFLEWSYAFNTEFTDGDGNGVGAGNDVYFLYFDSYGNNGSGDGKLQTVGNNLPGTYPFGGPNQPNNNNQYGDTTIAAVGVSKLAVNYSR